MTDVREILRNAGRQRRTVRVTGRYRGEAGDESYEREWEPYALDGDTAYVFSYFRNEFRRVQLSEIVKLEICDRTFEPRRPIEL
jgi:hypothetical protein